MNILLDTHIALWLLSDDARLSDTARNLIQNPDNEIFYSVISMWEVSIKHSAGKNMPISGKEFLLYCEAAGFRKLELDSSHVFNLENLYPKENSEEHKDPFDRILLAQAKAEGMILLTHDRKFSTWAEKCYLVV